MLIFDIKINDDGLIKISDFYVGMPYSEMRQILSRKNVEIKESPSNEPDHTTITICELRSYELYDEFFIQIEVYKTEFVSVVALAAAPSNMHQYNMAKLDLIHLFDDIAKKSSLKVIDVELQRILGIKGEYLCNDKYAVSMHLEGDFLFLMAFEPTNKDIETNSDVKPSLNPVFRLLYVFYLLGLVVAPICALVSLCTQGWLRVFLCSIVVCLSPIVFFVQANHIRMWIEAKKHGVKLGKLSCLGVNPLIGLCFLFNIPSYLWCITWKISTDNGFWEYFTDISPIFIWLILFISFLKKYNSKE